MEDISCETEQSEKKDKGHLHDENLGWERSEKVTGFQDISHRAPKKQTLALESISEASLSERFWGSKNLFLFAKLKEKSLLKPCKETRLVISKVARPSERLQNR